MGNKIRDYKHYADRKELAAQRAAGDLERRELHRQFDLSAKDTHMKYERPSFAVVTASDAFRAGWDNIFGTKPTGQESSNELLSSNLTDAPESPTGA